jgi:hypothetical protein
VCLRMVQYLILAYLLTEHSACIVSILRLEALFAVLQSDDMSWDLPLSLIWSCLEINTGIFCACIPVLKALATRIFPRLLGTTTGGQSFTHSSNLRSWLSPQPQADTTAHVRPYTHGSWIATPPAVVIHRRGDGCFYEPEEAELRLLVTGNTRKGDLDLLPNT